MATSGEDGRAAHNASGNAPAPFALDVGSLKDVLSSWFSGEQTPPFSAIVDGAAVLLLLLTVFALHYTFWQLLATLAIVEAPQSTSRAERPRSSKKDDGSETSAPVHETRITSSIRATLLHLYRTGGPTAFWRGCIMCLPYGLAYLFLKTTVETVFHSLGPTSLNLDPYVSKVSNVLTTTMLATWATAFTHIVITKPTSRIWYRRFPPLNTFKHTWAATAIHQLVTELTYPWVTHLAAILGLKPDANSPFGGGDGTKTQIVLFWLAWLVAQTLRLGILLPTRAAQTRVQASLLPDDEDTIVPLNRSFDKRAPPGLLKKHAPLSFTAALSSFDMADLVRISILYAKFSLVEAAIRLAFSVVLGKEAWPAI